MPVLRSMPEAPSPQSFAILSPSLLPEIRTYLQRHRADLEARLACPGEDGLALAQRRSKVLDGLLVSLFQVASTMVKAKTGRIEVSLAAVGSYGQGLVGWASEVDVCVLTSGPIDVVKTSAEAFFRPLREAGIALRHRVLTPSEALELAHEDWGTLVSLLDWRKLAGDAAFSDAFAHRLREELTAAANSSQLWQRLGNEAAARHHPGASGCLAEPDVEQGAGGFCDLKLASWAARARWHGSDWAELVRVGALLPQEAEALRDAADFLWRVRHRLHWRSGRSNDRLSLEMQKLLARDFGYADASVSDEALEPHVESFMSDYHRHARTISRLCKQVVARAMSR